MISRKSFLILSACIAVPASALAQSANDLDQPAGESAAPAQSSQNQPAARPAQGGSDQGGGFLGGDVPFFNPGNELLTWDGRSWNVNNNRLFQARFEKYLNTEEESDEDSIKYRKILDAIMKKLAPGEATSSSLDEAFKLLPLASDFEIDANLCDGIANAVYSVWQSRRENERLKKAQETLDYELEVHEWNALSASRDPSMNSRPPSRDSASLEAWKQQMALRRDLKIGPITTRAAEVKALILANQLKRETTQLQAKVEFQALIVQLFMQRRFQHVLISTRFYRSIFGDGDTLLRVGDDAKALFSQTTGMPPTVAVMDSLANEMIRDATEGVSAYRFLLEREELESATKRLAESFVVGEYLPALRTLPRDEKRQALAFAQQTNQLINALEVKDYALAEKIINGLSTTAKDFDSSQAMAAIETARTISAMHLAKARNAAVSGDRETLEVELKAATEMWPRNPALAEVSQLIFSQADVQQQALIDLDQLLSQRNYRQIFDDQIRFIAASAMFPERQEKLREVLTNMHLVEAAINQASEIAKRGDNAGAWESIERAYIEFPDDMKLSQVRADITTRAADFVRTLRTAEELEERGQTGSSLAWFLKAQHIYPASDFAREGIQRMVGEFFPETVAEF